MQEMDYKLKDEYNHIRSKTIYEIFIMTFLVSILTAIPSIGFSLMNTNAKLVVISVFILITLFCFLGVLLIKKNIKKISTQLWFYLLISIIYSIFLALTSPNKFMTTLSIAILAFTVIIFHTLSKKMLLIQGGVTCAILIYYGVIAVGQTVDLGLGYLFSIVGNYVLIVLVFLKGITMYQKFEELYRNQLQNLGVKNLELRALNEEYLAAEEELVSKYDEIGRLNKDMNNLNNFLTSIMNVTEDGFLIYNLNKNELKLYNGLDKTLGITEFTVEEELPDLMAFIIESDRVKFNKAWEQIYKDEKKFEEIELHYNNKSRNLDLRFTMINMNTDEDRNIIISVKDITNQKDNERNIFHRLEHDRLTGALNLSGFINALNNRIEVQHDIEFYMVLFDLDNFKYINNSFGHEIGDRVIMEIINELKNEEYGFEHVARAEGDTMLFVAKRSTSYNHVIKIMKKILRNIIIDEMDFKLNASVGIAEAHNNVKALELVRNAEMAMYKVKESGKGDFATHDDDYRKQMDRKYKIFRMLNKAIEQKEFHLVFQPIISLTDSKIKGFEALARWESPELGIVSPFEFIDMAEKTGQIIELGYYIMERAMEFAAEALKINNELVVSINISPRQLLEESFISDAVELINKAGIKPKNVAFEITENAYIENIVQVKGILEVIKKIGIEIFLDDFGTGYSSLNYLNKLPINVLKIDKSFVDTIHKSEQAKELINSITLLSNSMGYKSIAEGVEDKEAIEVLKDSGCEFVQGYYFDKPLKKQEALERIHNIYIT